MLFGEGTKLIVIPPELLMSKIMQEQNPDLESQAITVPLESEKLIKAIAALEFLIQVKSLWNNYVKHFGDGTELIVTDRNLNADLSPKFTIFFPSIAEINLHKTGTYLCLLEEFFPGVIKIDWKEQNGGILKSQAGNTTKTGDTYMKFSWLTVPEMSMDKAHICVVKHEFNGGGKDQEIFFPSINKVKKYLLSSYQETNTVPGPLTTKETDGFEITTPAVIKNESNTDSYATKVSLEDESGPLELQLTQSSAIYTYALLLLKSVFYFAIITCRLCRRAGSCSNGKSP